MKEEFKEKLDEILDLINEGLGEWQDVTFLYCPRWMVPFKKAQKALGELLDEEEE